MLNAGLPNFASIEPKAGTNTDAGGIRDNDVSEVSQRNLKRYGLIAKAAGSATGAVLEHDELIFPQIGQEAHDEVTVGLEFPDTFEVVVQLPGRVFVQLPGLELDNCDEAASRCGRAAPRYD